MAFSEQIIILSTILVYVVVAQQSDSLVADWLAKQSNQYEKAEMVKYNEVRFFKFYCEKRS